MTDPLLTRLAFDGFELAAPQTLGPIRLVPVINADHRDDIRLGLEGYDAWGIVDLGGPPKGARKQYWSYIPHGLLISWGKDGESATSFGADLRKNVDRPRAPVKIHHRMAKRTGSNEFRILPMHLAMEGFLSLHFGGPDIAWSNYSRHTKRFGLSPRVEFAYGANMIEDLAEAMHLFEIHENQVGVLLFIADELASAFVVSHPEDYRRLHPSILRDSFSEVFLHYARHAQIGRLDIDLDTDGVTDLAALTTAVDDVRTKWHQQTEVMAAGLAGQQLTSEVVNKMGPFQIERFRSHLTPEHEAHIGEAIVHQSGALQYLKTFRLSKNQTKRAHLLQMLAEHDWSIEALAETEGNEPDDIVRRMHNAGFGYLLNPEVLARATRRR